MRADLYVPAEAAPIRHMGCPLHINSPGEIAELPKMIHEAPQELLCRPEAPPTVSRKPFHRPGLKLEAGREHPLPQGGGQVARVTLVEIGHGVARRRGRAASRPDKMLRPKLEPPASVRGLELGRQRLDPLDEWLCDRGGGKSRPLRLKLGESAASVRRRG